MPVSTKHIRRLAGFELNALRAAEILGESFEKVRVPSIGTPVYDINGTILFFRLPLKRGRTDVGFADIAATEEFAEPLLAITMGVKWDENAILAEAASMAREKHQLQDFNRTRIVAYSLPKIAIQFLQNNKEVLMLEWKTWDKVPPQSTRRRPMEPSNFERWSFLDEMADEVKKSRVEQFKARQAIWEVSELKEIDPGIINKEVFKPADIAIKLNETKEIHYSSRADDHYPCYELRGQQTSVWCVAASVEMLMNFYRYNYEQPRLAAEMSLGTCDHPNGLPYGDEHKVVDTIEKLSSNTLDAAALVSPAWSVYTAEISSNRPMISFIPGHSRTVAGFTYSLFHLPGELAFKGLLVYDPWPPTNCKEPENGGVITRWENFNTQTYRHAFTAKLKHV